MADKRLVLTGAHSYLGQKLLAELSDKGGYEIAAFITPWSKEDGLVTDNGIKYFKVDLTKPLPDEAAVAVRNADFVLHFAWIRGKRESDVIDKNLAMLANLRTHIKDMGSLVFISSVAASPATLSRYGRTKFRIAERLREDGATILVTGLIVDKEPKGPYELLVKVVRKLPIAFRFTPNSVKVYPIRTDDFLLGVRTILDQGVPAGSYRLYPSQPDDINYFLSQLEAKYPRTRITVPVSYRISMGGLKLLHKFGLLPTQIGEKLLTFLYKDDAYLATHATLRDTETIDRPLSEMI